MRITLQWVMCLQKKWCNNNLTEEVFIKKKKRKFHKINISLLLKSGSVLHVAYKTSPKLTADPNKRKSMLLFIAQVWEGWKALNSDDQFLPPVFIPGRIVVLKVIYITEKLMSDPFFSICWLCVVAQLHPNWGKKKKTTWSQLWKWFNILKERRKKKTKKKK